MSPLIESAVAARTQESVNIEIFEAAKEAYPDLWTYYKHPSKEILQAKCLVNRHKRYVIEFDGCTRSNPGRAASAFVIRDSESEDEAIFEYAVGVGTKLLNQAEYLALSYGLHVAG